MKNYFKTSQSASIIKTSIILNLLQAGRIIAVIFLLLCAFGVAQLQASYTFTENDFELVINSNNYADEGDGQYNLVLGDSSSRFESMFMHHKTPLDLSKPFVFSAKFLYLPNYTIAPTPRYPYGYNEGLTFVLHGTRPYDCLSGCGYVSWLWLRSQFNYPS